MLVDPTGLFFAMIIIFFLGYMAGKVFTTVRFREKELKNTDWQESMEKILKQHGRI